MLENFKSQLAEGYAKEKAKQAKFAAEPSSPAAKNYQRKGGLLLIGIGSLALLVNIISWSITGRALIIIVATMLGCWAIGIWLLITGRGLKQ